MIQNFGNFQFLTALTQKVLQDIKKSFECGHWGIKIYWILPDTQLNSTTVTMLLSSYDLICIKVFWFWSFRPWIPVKLTFHRKHNNIDFDTKSLWTFCKNEFLFFKLLKLYSREKKIHKCLKLKIYFMADIRNLRFTYVFSLLLPNFFYFLLPNFFLFLLPNFRLSFSFPLKL